MIKKIVSIILALALCIGFSASAATVDIEHYLTWDDLDFFDTVNFAISESLVPSFLQSNYSQAITRA